MREVALEKRYISIREVLGLISGWNSAIFLSFSFCQARVLT